MKPIPILLAVQELTQGGSERQLAEMAKSLDRARFTPHVAVFRPGGLRVEELRVAGIPVTCFPFHSFASARALAAGRLLGAYLRQHNIQLVHSFDVPSNIFVVPVARLFRTPVVLSSQRAYRDLVSAPYRKLLRLTDHLANGIVVNCRALQRHLVEDENVPESQIHLCYNGIDTEVFRTVEKKRPAVLADASLVAGVVCALRPEKGLPTLVEAFAQARNAFPGMKLLIVGNGPERPQLEQMARDLQMAPDCVFIPATADVREWLQAIDIFVLPSLSEAFSNSLMEAMACGCAVIASKVGGNPELVAEGERGLLFRAGDSVDLADKLRLLVRDRDLRRRMVETGRTHIHEHFPIAVAARRMTAIYNKFLAQTGMI